MGKYQAAIDYLKDYKAVGEVTPIAKYGAMGDAYSELQDFDSAMKYYKKAAAEEENDVLTPYYLKKVGMLHEHNGNFAEAKKVYQQIKDDFPNSASGRDIDKYLARVSAKG